MLGVGSLIVFAILARRAEQFWQRIKQGVVILKEPRRYLREVASWQGLGWLFRFARLLGLPRGVPDRRLVHNVMLVMSVQAISTIVPFTPGGAGAQQALLVATLEGPSRAAVLSFSVGTQIAMAAWSVVLGFAAILLVFRTTDWRGLIREAEEERERSAKRARRREARRSRLSSTSPGSGRDLPVPRRPLGGGEVVVVAPGQRLQRDQLRVVAKQHPHSGRGLDVGRARPCGHPFPAEAGTV